MDVEAHLALERLADIEQEMLGPARKRVVADQQQPMGPRDGAGRGAPGRVEIGGAIVNVGLQIGALAPFVPGVHADEGFAEERLARGAVHELGEPALVFLRARALQTEAAALPARVIVPVGRDGLDQRKIRRGLGKRTLDHVVIGEDIAAEGVIEEPQLAVDAVEVAGHLVRRKLDGAVDVVDCRVDVVEGLAHDEDGIFAILAEDAPPGRESFFRLGDDAGAIDHQQRPSGRADIAGIAKMAQEVGAERGIVFGAIILTDQNLALHAVPASRPVLIRPHQCEGHVDVRCGEKSFERFLQQPVIVEIIVVVDESMHAAGLGHLGLSPDHVGVEQIVESEIARNARLKMVLEARQAAREICPFGETLAPPFVVFGDRVELREIIGEHLGLAGGASRQGPQLLVVVARFGEFLHQIGYRLIGLGRLGENARPVRKAEIVEQGVARVITAEITPDIEIGVEIGRRVAPFAEAVTHVMFIGVDARGGDVGVGLQVIGGVKLRQRRGAGFAGSEIMQQRALVAA